MAHIQMTEGVKYPSFKLAFDWFTPIVQTVNDVSSQSGSYGFDTRDVWEFSSNAKDATVVYGGKGFEIEKSGKSSHDLEFDGDVAAISIFGPADSTGAPSPLMTITDVDVDASKWIGSIEKNGSQANKAVVKYLLGGDDEIVSANKKDYIRGFDGNDTIHAGGGNDKVFGDDGDDVLFGEDGDDKLIGNKGDDTISGGDGADSIYGGKGDDVLTGGDGADLFVFKGKIDDDTITDFELGVDTLMVNKKAVDLAALDLSYFSEDKDGITIAYDDGEITLEGVFLSDVFGA